MINKFITPNLPDYDITSAIVSCEITNEIEYSLGELGVKPIKIYGNMNCDKAIKNHPDIYFMHFSPDRVLAYMNICSSRNNEELLFEKCKFAHNNDKKIVYPYDAGLNAVILGKRMICNINTVNREILDSAISDGYEIIHVNQGYTKCNVSVVDNKSIITEDYGIANECRRYGIDVLLLEHKAVSLISYAYGFIGGASGKVSADKLAFFGNIKLHPEYDSIYKFLYKRDVEAISLSNDKLYDYGSLMPLF